MRKFELIELPYAPNGLEPVISAETISFHYGKHLQALQGFRTVRI
jgi:Fe-Mn family superoxide dismutase